VHAEQERRRRRRDPAKSAARVEALKLHGARIRERHADPIGVPPVGSLAETVNIAKRTLWVQAAAAEESGDRDAADRLYHKASLMGPVRRPDTGSPLVGVDADEGDSVLDWLDDFGPHA
jgi:hypothetical protein